MSGEKEEESKAEEQLEEGLRGLLLVEQREESVESPQWKLRWSKLPELVRRDLMVHYFTAQDIVTLDTAVAEKEERKHLVNAFVGLRSAGLDGYTYRLKWVNNKVGAEYPGIKWCWKRGVDLRDFCLRTMREQWRYHSVVNGPPSLQP